MNRSSNIHALLPTNASLHSSCDVQTGHFQLYLGHFLEQLERPYHHQYHIFLTRMNLYDVLKDNQLPCQDWDESLYRS